MKIPMEFKDAGVTVEEAAEGLTALFNGLPTAEEATANYMANWNRIMNPYPGPKIITKPLSMLLVDGF